MSEVIHQELAIEVTEYLHSNGEYLIGDPSIEKTKGATSYESNYVMLGTFLNRYKQDIIDGRLSDKGFKKLTSIVPIENIEQLNGLVKEYSVLPHLNIFSAIQNGKVTPDVMKRDELIDNMKSLMNHFDSRMQSKLLESAIEATETTTRLSQINDAAKQIINTVKTVSITEQKKDSEQRSEI